MNGNIDGTIELVVTKIASLQDLLVRLQSFKAELAAPSGAATVPTAQWRAVPSVPPLAVVRAPKAAMPRVNGKPRPVKGSKQTLVEACAGLAAPFTAADLARAMGTTIHRAQKGIWGLVNRTKQVVPGGKVDGEATYRMAPGGGPKTVRRPDATRTWLHDARAKLTGLPTPFKAEDVAKVLRVEHKRASNWIVQAKLKGWVQSAGLGTYTFAGAVPTPETTRGESRDGSSTLTEAAEAPENPNANAIAELKHQLAEACKKRDRYRTNENDTLMNIEQSRIDRLEGQIAALES